MLDVRQEILGLLQPLVGEALAKSVLKVSCERAGVDPDRLRLADLRKVAAEIATGLGVFVGAERARQIAAQVEALEKRK